MKITQIRPCSVYLGHGGEAREVTGISMNVSGELNVSYKFSRKDSVPSCKSGWTGGMPIKEFAAWAKLLVRTSSDDLRPLVERPYVPDAAE